MDRMVEIKIMMRRDGANPLEMARVEYASTNAPNFVATAPQPEEALARVLEMLARDLRERVLVREELKKRRP